jgi:hypothetical protein
MGITTWEGVPIYISEVGSLVHIIGLIMFYRVMYNTLLTYKTGYAYSLCVTFSLPIAYLCNTKPNSYNKIVSIKPKI